MSSYEALYRKYRPRNFADLVGQGHISATLSNAITDDRLTHAYLFTGPRGTGKTSSARIFAKSLNCEKGPTVTPCDVCPACEAIRRGNFPDVIEIDAASHRGVDDARDLRDRVRFAPTAGRYKVFIIDEVHMLTNEAFNALLKTIEEPPPNLVFILATTDVHKVLPTIVSRCQRFDFRRIPLKDLISRMTMVSAAEGFSVADEGLAAIARRADGGLRDALSLLDQVRANAVQATIDAQMVYEALGLVSTTAIHHLVGAIGRHELIPALAAVQDLLAAGFDHHAILRELTESFRHLMLLEAAGDRPEALDIPEIQVGPLRELAGMFRPVEILGALDVLRESETMLKGSNQMTIWLEMAMFRMVHRDDLPSMVELSRRVQVLEDRLANAPAAPASATAPRATSSPAPRPVASAPTASPAPAASPAQANAPSAPAAAPIVPASAPAAAPVAPPVAAPARQPVAPEGADLLATMLEVLDKLHRGTHSLIQQHCTYVRRNGTVLEVGIRSKGLMSIIEQRRSVLLQAAIQAFGPGYSVQVQFDGAEPPRPNLAGVGAAPAEAQVNAPTPMAELVLAIPAALPVPATPELPPEPVATEIKTIVAAPAAPTVVPAPAAPAATPAPTKPASAPPVTLPPAAAPPVSAPPAAAPPVIAPVSAPSVPAPVIRVVPVVEPEPEPFDSDWEPAEPPAEMDSEPDPEPAGRPVAIAERPVASPEPVAQVPVASPEALTPPPSRTLPEPARTAPEPVQAVPSLPETRSRAPEIVRVPGEMGLIERAADIFNGRILEAT